MILKYALIVLFFAWIAQMIAVISIATLEGGFEVKLNRKGIMGVLMFSSFASILILTLILK